MYLSFILEEPNQISWLLLENQQKILWLNKRLEELIKDDNKRLQAITILLDADPTNEKKFVQWLYKLLTMRIISIQDDIMPARANTQIQLPEDLARLRNVLITYNQALARLPMERRNIFGFRDFYSLENAVENAVNSGTVRAGALSRNIQGAEVIYHEAPYTIYYVKKVPWDTMRIDLSPEEEVRVRAVEELGMGPPETKWCTRRDYNDGQNAVMGYISQRDIYIIYKDGVPFSQVCGREIRNIYDRKMQLPDDVSKIISNHMVNTTRYYWKEAVELIHSANDDAITLIEKGDYIFINLFKVNYSFHRFYYNLIRYFDLLFPNGFKNGKLRNKYQTIVLHNYKYIATALYSDAPPHIIDHNNNPIEADAVPDEVLSIINKIDEQIRHKRNLGINEVLDQLDPNKDYIITDTNIDDRGSPRQACRRKIGKYWVFDYDKLVDAGFFYYVAIKKLNSTSYRPPKQLPKIEFLANTGLASFEIVSVPRIDYIYDGESMREKHTKRNMIKLTWNYKVITIAKHNVIKIVEH